MKARSSLLITAVPRALLLGLLAAPLAGPHAPARAAGTDYVADAARLVSAGDLAAARLQLRNAIKADPKNAAAHYQLGVLEMHLGDPSAAEREARAAQTNGYSPADALWLLTEAYLAQDRPRDVLRDFPALPGGPAGTSDIAAVTLTARGKAQILLQRYDDAAASLTEAERLDPKLAGPVLAEARLALIQRDQALAGAKVEAALKLEPNSAEALQLQSAFLADKGDQQGAIAAADKSVAAAPGEAAYRLERARLLIAYNRNDDARKDVDVILTEVPGNQRAIYYRAVLESRDGKFDLANADLDKLSDYISKNPGAYLVLALVKERVGQHEQALDAAARYHARNPSDARGALLLGRLQLAAKLPNEAIRTLQPIADTDIKEAEVYDLLGIAQVRVGRNQEALDNFQKALVLKPDDPALLARAGSVRLALNQTEGAASMLERSLSLTPEQPRTEALLVMALLDTGKFDQAQKSIDALRAQQGNTEMVALLTGALHLSQFKLDQARQDFEAVAHDHPDSADARLSLSRVAMLQGRTDDRIRLLGEVLQRQPARVAVVNELTDQLLLAKKNAEAIAVLERAHAAAPTDPRFLSRLATLYISTGQAKKALALADEAPPPPPPSSGPAKEETAVIRPHESPREVPRLLVRAEAQAALKQNANAEKTYRDVLEILPKFTFARLQLIRLTIDDDRMADAKSVLEDGLANDPQNEQLLRAALEIAARDGGFPAALKQAATLGNDTVHQPASLGLEGDLYFGAKRFDEAITSYQAAMQTAPSALLAVHMAVAQISLKQLDAAAKTLRDWLGKHPGDAEAEQLLSDLDLKAERYDTAKPLLADLATKRPNDAKVLNNLAWVDMKTGDPQAAGLAQRAYLLAPGPQTADTWGYIMATGGGGDHGLSLLRLAASQAPGDAGIKYHLAVAYQAAGEPAEAVKVLTPLVADSGEFAEKQQAQKLLATLSTK